MRAAENVAVAKLDGILGFDLLGEVPFVFDAPGRRLWILDPPPGVDGTLRVSAASRFRSMFGDPLPGYRAAAAKSVSAAMRFEFLPELACLLDDDASEVVETAVQAIATLAAKTGDKITSVDDARHWWNRHKDDPAFASLELVR
jgi:hypothetical protein